MNIRTLTNDEITHYRDQGYLTIPNFLTTEELVPVIDAMNQQVAQIAQALYTQKKVSSLYEGEPFEQRLARLFDNLPYEDFLQFGQSWRERMPGYFDLITNSKILSALTSIIGPEIYASSVYNTRPKIPKVAVGAVPWHQDKSYWPGYEVEPIITVWVALVDVNEHNGCLHVSPGSHQAKVIEHQRESYTQTEYFELPAEYTQNIEPLPLPLNKGSVIIFNDRFFHMSTLNNSDAVRWSVDLRYHHPDPRPMPKYGGGCLVHSHATPEKIVTVDDWLANKMEHL